MIKKLSLGTAQFGLDYGINNSRGQVTSAEVRELLRMAYRSGIDTLDTAYAYGESESVLGACFDDEMEFKVVTKYPADEGGKVPEEIWQESFRNLGCREIYGYLLHSFQKFKDGGLSIIDFLQGLKAQGKVKKTGFSLYEPAELEKIIDSQIPFELVQVPFSILDQRFLPYFQELKTLGIEIHARSVFLQGLVFKTPDSLGKFFQPVKKALNRISQKAEKFDLSTAELCLGFSLAQPEIDRVIVGVDSVEQLQQNIRCTHAVGKISEHLEEISELKCTNEMILNPSKWEVV